MNANFYNDLRAEKELILKTMVKGEEEIAALCLKFNVDLLEERLEVLEEELASEEATEEYSDLSEIWEERDSICRAVGLAI